MAHPSPAPEPGFPDDRLVRLTTDAAGHVLVSPAGTVVSPPRFEAFPLPRLPLSVLHWCSAVAALARGRRRACLAVVLLLDPELRRWIPFLPTQVCSRRGVRWALLASDYHDLPARLLIAGSFQGLPPGGVFDAAAAVPALGGVHVVELRRGGRGRPPGSFLFVRGDADQEPALADPAVVLVDDLDQALREAADCLRVE